MTGHSCTRLYMLQFGQNANGELGVGDARQRYSPTVVEFSLGKDVVQVTAGNELTAVLTNTGEVRMCRFCMKSCPIAVTCR